MRNSCTAVLVELSSSSSPEQWASRLRWHLSLWLGRVDWSCRQTCGVWCLWWHSLHLFASCFPSTAGACSRPLCCRCSPSANQQLLLSPPHSPLRDGSSSMALFPLATLSLLCDSASPILFVWKRDQKQSVPSLCPKWSIWSFSFSKITLYNCSSVMIQRTVPELALKEMGFSPLGPALSLSTQPTTPVP